MSVLLLFPGSGHFLRPRLLPSGGATRISLLNVHCGFLTSFSAASLALFRPFPTQQPERSLKKNVDQIIPLLCLKSSNNSKKKKRARKLSNNSHCDHNKLQIPSFVLKTQPGPRLPLIHVFRPFWPSFVSSKLVPAWGPSPSLPFSSRCPRGLFPIIYLLGQSYFLKEDFPACLKEYHSHLRYPRFICLIILISYGSDLTYLFTCAYYLFLDSGIRTLEEKGLRSGHSRHLSITVYKNSVESALTNKNGVESPTEIRK